jgi:integrase/recombinase XerD
LWLNRWGKPYRHYMMDCMLRQHVKAAGINKQITPHCLRHAFATSLARNECPPTTLAKLMGHGSLRSTARYVRLVAVDLKKQVDKKHPTNRRKEKPKAAEPKIQRLRGYYNHAK